MAFDPTAAADALTQSLSGPAEVSGDAGTVRQHNLADQITALRYLTAMTAADNPRRGLRFNRIVPPGAADVRRPLPAWPYFDWSEPLWR